MEWVNVMETESPKALSILEHAVASYVNKQVGDGEGACQALSPKPGGLQSVFKQDLGDRMKVAFVLSFTPLFHLHPFPDCLMCRDTALMLPREIGGTPGRNWTS
jgi:hypothetical protein